MKPVKQAAKRVQVRLAELGIKVSHAQALDVVAAEAGHASWNVYRAKLLADAQAEKAELRWNKASGPMSPKQYVNKGGCNCPVCGSSAIEGDEVDIDAGIATQDMSCNSCGAGWQDYYNLTGYGNLDDSLVDTDEAQKDNADAYIQVEYDLAYTGGDYGKVGEFVYLPKSELDHLQLLDYPDAVARVFENHTGHSPVHIITYSEDDVFDVTGNRL